MRSPLLSDAVERLGHGTQNQLRAFDQLRQKGRPGGYILSGYPLQQDDDHHHQQHTGINLDVHVTPPCEF